MKLHVLATFAALLALAIAARAQGPGGCGTNEVRKECVSSSCAEKTCTRRVIPPICSANCIFGCFCDDDHYRNAEGRCVTEEECPP
uniref:Putative tick til 1 n=1 Tax=Amblyomma tuberculatum TaxID=48802 RepID=A0A6M2E3M4_9ACAR